VLLIGCQPEELDDYGGSLRPVVKAALEDAALALAVEQHRRLGRPPAAAHCAAGRARGRHLARARWRPTKPAAPAAEEACRFGDSRFLPGGLTCASAFPCGCSPSPAVPRCRAVAVLERSTCAWSALRVGDWLLVFRAARERLDAGRAAEIDAALDLLEGGRSGGDDEGRRRPGFALPSAMSAAALAALSGRPRKENPA
jgi:hypothetical protein